jgi:hypothetical protein
MRKRVETLDIFNTTLLVLFGLAVLFPFYNVSFAPHCTKYSIRTVEPL